MKSEVSNKKRKVIDVLTGAILLAAGGGAQAVSIPFDWMIELTPSNPSRVGTTVNGATIDATQTIYSFGTIDFKGLTPQNSNSERSFTYTGPDFFLESMRLEAEWVVPVYPQVFAPAALRTRTEHLLVKIEVPDPDSKPGTKRFPDQNMTPKTRGWTLIDDPPLTVPFYNDYYTDPLMIADEDTVIKDIDVAISEGAGPFNFLFYEAEWDNFAPNPNEARPDAFYSNVKVTLIGTRDDGTDPGPDPGPGPGPGPRPMPIPATTALIGLGMLGLGAVRRRRR